MKAVVVSRCGGPEVLELTTLPIPKPAAGQVLIRVKAFGLNRLETYIRQGTAPMPVDFPRVLGNECVGEVVDAPGSDLQPGQQVAAIMGGMGINFDGSYAEYTLIPRKSVFPVRTALDWATFGALPEMFQTTNGSLTTGLKIGAGQSLLIRGGTSSIGMTAAVLAKAKGMRVLATTRNPKKTEALLANGAEHVILDTGDSLEESVRKIVPNGVDRVLELVGTSTLADSLRCCAAGGIVCMTGMLSGNFTLDGFRPLSNIPNGVFLTSYAGGSEEMTADDLQRFIDSVDAGRATANLDRVFHLDEIQDAHRYVEDDRACGKVVVLV